MTAFGDSSTPLVHTLIQPAVNASRGDIPAPLCGFVLSAGLHSGDDVDSDVGSELPHEVPQLDRRQHGCRESVKYLLSISWSIMAAIPRKKWYRIQWYADQDTVEERKLILKLDFLIVPYAFLAYWAKYMDQANLNNAYVAGLKEDLNFESNQLVRLQTMYILGAVLGQIPLLFLFNFIPMFCVIPAMDIAWGIFTLLQYRAHSFAELAAYRFFVGLFEAAFIPGIHYIFGSWYRGHEVARRGGVFYVVLTLGTLTAGLIQAGASARLNGVHGPAGWRWMYIICSVITIPISILGIFILPGTPDQLNKTFLNDKDIELAKSRLERTGHSTSGKFKIGTLAMVAGNWRFWALLLLDIFFGNGSYNTSAGGYLLWLKSLKRYPASRINELGAIAPAVGIFYTLFICFASDLIL